MNMVILIGVFTAFTIPETIILKRKNKVKELYIFLSFMTLAFVLSLLVINGAEVPSINKIVGDWVLEMIGG